MSYWLGKLPATLDSRDLRAARLLAQAALPTPPPRFGHGYSYKDWSMLGNGPDDSVAPNFPGCGDCVFADAGHITMLTNKLARHPIQITGKEVVSDYSALTGYVIGNDASDQGTEMREALGYRRSTGVVDVNGNRHKIGAYVAINLKDWEELRAATYVFTAVSIGFEFPSTAWTQFHAGRPWDLTDTNSPIEGGHDVPVIGFATPERAGVVTWGDRQGMTRAFYEQYADEAWAIIFPEELRNGKTWRGFDIATLNADLAQLGGP